MALENHESQYLNMLEIAFAFLHRKVRAANGTPINQTVHDFVISYGAQCPHCGINLSRSNSNTEHIHDLALGGENKSYNKIIMCRDCNLARNKTMQVYLGAPSYWRGFPGIGTELRIIYCGMQLQSIRVIVLEKTILKFTVSLNQS